MHHPMHDSVVELVDKAIVIMDGFLRDRMDLAEYAANLNKLDADAVLAKYSADFKDDVKLVYYLDALMMLSSLQHELDFQVAEYGANVANEDIKMLRELLHKFGHNPQSNRTAMK
jgi:hypothetical protein